MKIDPNITAGAIGVAGAILKGVKKKNKMRTIFINMIIGGTLAFLSMDLVPLFFPDVSNRTSLLISFSIGYLSNEFTEQLEDLLVVFFDSLKNKIKNI